MKKWIWILLAVMLLTACGQNKENDREKAIMSITAEEAKAIMDSEEGYIILDVRTQEEYDEGHIPGAILIPNTEIEARAEENLPDKDQLILVYCRNGRVAPHCQWQMKRGISVCSGRQETSLHRQATFLPGTTNGPA